MIDHPFPLFRRFQDRLTITLLTKEDRVRTDAEISGTLGATTLASLWQMHGNRTVLVSEPTSRTKQADGLATDKTGLTLTIRAADCQNFVIYAPDRHVLCLVHAGWRGMKGKVLSHAFDSLRQEWGIEAAETWVGAGPSLCRHCAEFSSPAEELPELQQFTIDSTVDLQAAADAELASLGVPRSHIDRPLGCTRCQPGRFWTYRGGDREAVKEGWTNCLAAVLGDVVC